MQTSRTNMSPSMRQIDESIYSCSNIFMLSSDLCFGAGGYANQRRDGGLSVPAALPHLTAAAQPSPIQAASRYSSEVLSAPGMRRSSLAPPPWHSVRAVTKPCSRPERRTMADNRRKIRRSRRNIRVPAQSTGISSYPMPRVRSADRMTEDHRSHPAAHSLAAPSTDPAARRAARSMRRGV